ncbi:hypothetical protein TKK_0000346 [Trichogramma kaykai]
MLDVIGQPLTEDRQLAEPVHSKLASRWDEVLRLGLPKEEKGELLKKYPPPSNCTFLDPPKLNPEIELSLNESSQAITLLMSMKGDNHVPIIEWLSNTAKLIMDTMHDEMEIRRSLVLANVNLTIKDALASSKADEKYLFGGNLSDTLKQAQATNKDVQVIAKKSAIVAGQSPKNPKNPTRHSSKTSTSAYGQQRSGRKSQRCLNAVLGRILKGEHTRRSDKYSLNSVKNMFGYSNNQKTIKELQLELKEKIDKLEEDSQKNLYCVENKMEYKLKELKKEITNQPIQYTDEEHFRNGNKKNVNRGTNAGQQRKRYIPYDKSFSYYNNAKGTNCSYYNNTRYNNEEFV